MGYVDNGYHVVFKRYAFISYNHKDEKEARWLHKHLEGYKLPNDIFNEYDDAERYLRPIFRDKEDIKAGILKSELRKELEASKYLIVVCSPNSAHSIWVNQEVQVFIELGRVDRIIPYIIDGKPMQGDTKECFPESLLCHVKENPNDELLGVNIQEVGREKALIRIVSSLLMVDFDSLWKRHKRERRHKIHIVITSTIIGLLCLSWLLLPITLVANIHDDCHYLPHPKDATCIIDNDSYPLYSLDTTLYIKGIPGYRRLHKCKVEFYATYYEKISKYIRLSVAGFTTVDLELIRDDSFSVFSGIVLNEDNESVCDAVVEIDDRKVLTDSLGYFNVRFPVWQQTMQKKLVITKDGYQSLIRDEVPFNGSTFYIFHK